MQTLLLHMTFQTMSGMIVCTWQNVCHSAVCNRSGCLCHCQAVVGKMAWTESEQQHEQLVIYDDMWIISKRVLDSQQQSMLQGQAVCYSKHEC